MRRLGLERDMRVQQFQRVLRLKGQPTGQHFVKGDTHRIEIRALIGAAIHPSRLLGRNVSRCAFRLRSGGRVFGCRGGKPEISQLEAAIVYDNVRRLDVLVDHLRPVHFFQDFRQLDRVFQKRSESEPLILKKGFERDAAEILQNQGQAGAGPFDRDRPDHTGKVEFPDDLVLMLQTGQIPGFGVFGRRWCLDDGGPARR